jgi:hypothetical protein
MCPKVSVLPPGARTANGRALCHKMQLYRYFVSQPSEFCRHNPLCCFSTSVYCCCLFRYRLSPETFGCTSVLVEISRANSKIFGLAVWSENCKWYSSLPLGAVVSLFCELFYGLEINAEKTKYMIMSRYPNSGQNQNIRIANESFEKVAKFRYLGTTLTNNDIPDEIKNRLNSGNACYYSVQNLLSSRLI